MRFKNFVIVLLAVLMVFAFASCKNDPGKKPETEKIYKLTATSGRDSSWNGADKFILFFNEGINLEPEDTFSFEFRSTRDFSQYSIRNTKCCWEYERSFDELTTEELEDGWTRVTYKFSNTFHNGSKTAPDYSDPTHTSSFRFDFRGSIIIGDYIELREITYNGAELTLTKDNVPNHSDDFYGAVNPELTVIDNHKWEINKNYIVYYTTTTLGDGHTPDYVEPVDAGGTIKKDISKPNYSYELYTSYTAPASEGEEGTYSDIFDRTTPITKDTILYVKYVGDVKTVKFMDGETELEALKEEVNYGSYAERPEAPEKEDKLFRDWYIDSSFSAAFDFENTIIEDNLTLYAKYEDPITVTFSADGGEPAPEDQKILKGATATRPENDPEKDNYEFLGWFESDETESVAFDFTKGIESDVTIYAKYREAIKYEVTFNLNYEECPEAQKVSVYDGNKLAKPTDPERLGYFFEKWTVEEAADSDEYDFDTAVTNSFPLYAQWTKAIAVSFDYNEKETPTTDTVYIVKGTAVDKPDFIANPGYVFLGWFEAGSETAFDFNTTIEEDLALTAKWELGTLYQFVSTIDSVKSGKPSGNDKYVLYYKGTEEAPQPTVNDGDVLSFRFRTTIDLGFINVRGDAKWVYEKTGPNYGMTTIETKQDGWTYVTFVFDSSSADSGTPPAEKAWWRFDFGSRTILVGDILEVQGWALNGEALPINDANVAQKDKVGESINPKYSVVQGGAYDWVSHTVSFVMGAGPEKAPENVEFGEKLEKPEDPEVEGYKFLGWFSDEALTTEFDFDCPIIANTTIYGGFEESSGVSYTVTFNPNFTGAVKQFVEVDEGDALVPAKVGNPGYYLEGWFTAGGDEIDFSTYEVTEDVELYAHWTKPTSYYEFTVGVANKRIAFRYSDDSEHYLGIAPKKGDTITFKYRVPEGKNFNKLYLRDFAGSSGSKFADGGDSSWAVATVSGPDDGWYSFSVTFDKLQSGAAYEFPVPGFLLELRYDGGFVVGDIIEVMGFAYNGEELEITDDYHMGIRTNEGADNAKDDTKPTMKIIPIGE